MAQFVEAIPHLLLRVFAPMLGICLAAWLVMLFAQLFSGKRHSCRLGKPVWAGLAALAIVCTTLCGKNTNGVQGVGGPLLQFNPPLALTVTPEDITNGWRVAEETEAESFAQPSANAITNEHWRRRGAFDDALCIPANGWSYPYATGVTVLARGELRTGIRTHDFPRAFAQDLSLLPLVNWQQLPEGRRESVFWYDATPSNTLLTTWWNAALGRDATNPVNFQAELFPDGGFTYRYEDRTVRHARVWPFDWDDDGLENTVDPDPLTPGPDAHGTSAEWYNTVCSNVLEAVATSCDPPGGRDALLRVRRTLVARGRQLQRLLLRGRCDGTRPCADLLHGRPRLAPRQPRGGGARGRHEPRAAPHRRRLCHHLSRAVCRVVPRRLHVPGGTNKQLLCNIHPLAPGVRNFVERQRRLSRDTNAI